MKDALLMLAWGGVATICLLIAMFGFGIFEIRGMVLVYMSSLIVSGFIYGWVKTGSLKKWLKEFVR